MDRATPASCLRCPPTGVFSCGFASTVQSPDLVRAIGGELLARIKPFIRRLLARPKQRPITTITVLRLIFWIGPPLNDALAMSNIRFREYFIGSALGLFIPVIAVALLFEWVLTNLV